MEEPNSFLNMWQCFETKYLLDIIHFQTAPNDFGWVCIAKGQNCVGTLNILFSSYNDRPYCYRCYVDKFRTHMYVGGSMIWQYQTSVEMARARGMKTIFCTLIFHMVLCMPNTCISTFDRYRFLFRSLCSLVFVFVFVSIFNFKLFQKKLFVLSPRNRFSGVRFW